MVRLWKLKISFILFTFIWGSNNSSLAEECLNITDDFRVPTLAVLRPAVKEIYEEAGLCVTFNNKPAPVAQKLFAEGKTDALLMRSHSTAKKFNIKYITPNRPLTHLHNVILSNKSRNLGPSLKEHATATIAVFAVLIKTYREILEPLDIHAFPFDERQFGGLLVTVEEGNLDGILVDNLYLNYLKQRDPTLDQRFLHSQKLWPRDGYLILAEKHQNLIEKLDKAIQKIRPNHAILYEE